MDGVDGAYVFKFGMWWDFIVEMDARSQSDARVRVFTVIDVKPTLELAERRVSTFKDECDKLQLMVAETRRLYREYFGDVPVRSPRQ